jgi:hypothetical protein
VSPLLEGLEKVLPRLFSLIQLIFTLLSNTSQVLLFITITSSTIRAEAKTEAHPSLSQIEKMGRDLSGMSKIRLSNIIEFQN